MIGALVAGITGSGGAVLSSYESIATATGTGSNASITFSSIPSGFKHLQVRYIARNTITPNTDASIAQMSVNGSTTTTDYAWHELRGDGATASASGGASAIPYYGMVVRDGASAGIMGVGIIDILDYGSTSKYKTIRSFSGNDRNGAGIVGIWSGLYQSTSAITSLTFYANQSSSTTQYFTTATTFALYGIKEA